MDIFDSIENKDLRAVEQYDGDIEVRNCSGYTPLMYASWRGNLQIVTSLLRKEANVNVYRYDGNTPLMMAVIFKKFDIVEKLIRSGADLTMRDEDGCTAYDKFIERSNRVDESVKQHLLQLLKC